MWGNSPGMTTAVRHLSSIGTTVQPFPRFLNFDILCISDVFAVAPLVSVWGQNVRSILQATTTTNQHRSQQHTTAITFSLSSQVAAFNLHVPDHRLPTLLFFLVDRACPVCLSGLSSVVRRAAERFLGCDTQLQKNVRGTTEEYLSIYYARIVNYWTTCTRRILYDACIVEILSGHFCTVRMIHIYLSLKCEVLQGFSVFSAVLKL